MSSAPPHEMSLDALVAAANQRLDAATLPAADPRTGDRLDVRTVRYYRTLELVDAPLRYDGTRAVFADKHLLQVVAIKALQRHGASLATAKQRLLGLGTKQLEKLIAELARAPQQSPKALAHVAAPPPPASAAPAKPAGSGHELVLDLAPGLVARADLGRAAEITALQDQARARLDELLQLVARLTNQDRSKDH